MSFSQDVKNEIVEKHNKKICCKYAQLYGMLSFAGVYSTNRITMKSENPAVIKEAAYLIHKICSVYPETTQSGELYSCELFDEDAGIVYSRLFAKEAGFACDNCYIAFVRGAFLSGGSISDPNKEYHLEIVSKNDASSWQLCSTLQKLGLDAKTTQRGNLYVVYIKDSECIEDFLTMIGATKAVLMYMNTKIYKDLRNQINRTSNCVAANMRKVGQSSGKYVDAINRIERVGMLDALPDDLKNIALARRDNFEMPLSELGAMFSLSRSGIHHRLKKILEFAEKLDQG
ncbi:MAG: DNA-binding protein WhiA [Clostridia bacterium]|nr:DNA-binding protein WhiA [Clostridia bacterium]